jgi:hypothetical protein
MGRAPSLRIAKGGWLYSGMAERTWKCVFGLLAAGFALACHRAPELKGPEPFLQIRIDPQCGWPPPIDPPCQLTFYGVTSQSPKPYGQAAEEMECDFPGGVTLRSPCFFLSVGREPGTMESIKEVPIPKDFTSMTLFKGKVCPVQETWRMGYSGPQGSNNRSSQADEVVRVYANFEMKRLPIRFRIYEGGKLICRGDIRLLEPAKTP